MERAVSGHGAARSSRVGLTVAGAQQRPHRRACGKPTTAPQAEKGRLQSIRLSCLSTRDKAWSSTAERMGQPLETLKMKEKKEIRCGHCNKLLGKGTARDLEIKCPRCGTLNHVRDIIPCSEPCDGLNGANHADPEEKIGN